MFPRCVRVHARWSYVGMEIMIDLLQHTMLLSALLLGSTQHTSHILA